MSQPFLASGLLLAMFAIPAAAEVVTIQYCYDGKTCKTTRGTTILLACLDVPDMKKQPQLRPTSMRALTYGNSAAVAARDFLSKLVEGKEVVIRRIATVGDDRIVADISVNDVNIGQRLVRSGHARVDRNSATRCLWAQND